MRDLIAGYLLSGTIDKSAVISQTPTPIEQDENHLRLRCEVNKTGGAENETINLVKWYEKARKSKKASKELLKKRKIGVKKQSVLFVTSCRKL
jgi:hypothetical protein